MFAKIFTQIFDSSIAEDYETRHVFEDLLKLANPDGEVDMTHEAIARRTNVPLEIIRSATQKLEAPDPKSRNPVCEGRRIVRMDDHRDWGWKIVNYGEYRGIASEENRREKGRERIERFRQRAQAGDATHQAAVTPGNAVQRAVTPGNACNAIQKETKTDKQNKTHFNAGVGAVVDTSEADESPIRPNGKPTGRQMQRLIEDMRTALHDWGETAAFWKVGIKADYPTLRDTVTALKRAQRNSVIGNPGGWLTNSIKAQYGLGHGDNLLQQWKDDGLI